MIAAVVVIAIGSSLAAAPAAPQLSWHTIHSVCCDVDYPEGLEHVARRVATIADESVKNASDLLASAPQERVQIVIHDETDSPNGFTNVVPYDEVDLRMVTPESDSDLGVTDEYLKLLVQHEILHIVHLDTIHGLPAVINVVIGKVWPPNLIQPRFVVEGLAVFAETKFTAGGRLRATIFSADLIIAALAGDLWQLDDLSSYTRRNPGGGGAYTYGAAFVGWLTRKYGEQIWPAIVHDYGGNAIPFAVQRSIEKATGHDMEDDYQHFLDDIRAQAQALKAAAEKRGGPTKSRRLTRAGGFVHGARFTNDGTLVVGLDPPDGVPGLYAIHGLPAAVPVLDPLVRTTEAVDVAVAGDTLVLSQTETTRGSYQFHDLWTLEAGGRPLRRITREARLRSPSWIPGTRTVVAEQRTANEAALVVVDVDSGAMTDLVRAGDGTLWYTPDVAPDGAHVTASRWLPGGARQIVELDLRTGNERVLTPDGSQNLDPSYTPDGRYVLFTSDREGVFCVYAVDRETREVRRIVDTLGLAKFPRATPDGTGVVYVDTHLEGNDLYAATLDIAHAPVVDGGTAVAAPPYREATAEAALPDERYNAFFTLLPRYWVPLLGNDAAGGLSLGAAVVGDDAVGQLSLAAQAEWGFALARPHLAATLRLADLYLPLNVRGEYRTDRSDRVRRTDGQPDVQQDSVVVAGAGVTIPILRSRRYSNTIALGYQRELHHVDNPLTSSPDARAPVYPPDANVGAVTLDWSYSGLESYRDSVSNERGLTSFVHIRHADKTFTFSEQDITEAVVDARVFAPVSGLGAHVVGLYLSGGVAFGEPLLRQSFFLGGFADRDITSDLLNGRRSGGGALRGYPAVTTGGDAFALATLEYRFPLVDVEHGISTLPLFLDRLHAAAFTDFGGAFSGPPDLTQFRASVGVELRAQVTLAYYGLFLIRAGYARGLSRDGVDQPYVLLGFPY